MHGEMMGQHLFRHVVANMIYIMPAFLRQILKVHQHNGNSRFQSAVFIAPFELSAVHLSPVIQKPLGQMWVALYLYFNIDEHARISPSQNIQLYQLAVSLLRLLVLVDKYYIRNMRCLIAIQHGVEEMNRQVFPFFISQ